MNEIEFYPELCAKIKAYLLAVLPENSRVGAAYNKMLPDLINDVNREIGIEPENNSYIPKLKLDIIVGVKLPDRKLYYVIFEVKYSNELALANYSQLSGYIQVAKTIECGILLLVQKSTGGAILSEDFHEIIRTNNLPMKWLMQLHGKIDNDYPFKTGICYYIPENGIDWVDTKSIDGVSSFEDLAAVIEASLWSELPPGNSC